MEQQTEMVNTEQKEAEIAPSIENLQAELEKTRTALKKANNESASHRHKAKELDELKSRLENEKLSEAEKLQTQLAQKEQEILKHQERVVRSEIKSAALSLGVINPALIAKLVDWSEIEYDENTGDPTNVEDLLKELIKNEPYLVGKQQTPITRTTATNPSRSSVQSDDVEGLLRRIQQGKLSNEEYATLPAHIRQKVTARLSTKKY